MYVKNHIGLYNSNKGLGFHIVLVNKSQSSGHNGLSPTGLRPLFRSEVCDLFANTILKPCPLLLHLTEKNALKNTDLSHSQLVERQ